MQNNLLKKGLVVGILVLFIGVGVYPAIAVNPVTSTNITQDEEIIVVEETEPKDYLFQTIIDIANNPEVQDLFEHAENDLINYEFDSRSVVLELLFKNPRLLFSMLFSKSSITYDYLDSAYNRGCEITNVLGEDKVIEMVESIEIANPELFDKLTNIIVNNEELSNKIAELAELNGELKQDSPFQDYPILCAILLIIDAFVILKIGICLALLIIMPGKLFWGLLTGWLSFNIFQFVIISYILIFLQCVNPPWI